jgi:hypothetical protein
MKTHFVDPIVNKAPEGRRPMSGLIICKFMQPLIAE